MTDYIAAFTNWLRDEDKSDQTIRTYTSVLSGFIGWYEQTEGKSFDPGQVTTVDIQDYRSHLMNVANRKPTTVNKVIATLKSFFAWADDQGHTKSNPANRVKMRRVQQALSPKWLTDTEVNRLLDALYAERNDAKQARDRAVIMTLLYAGLRVEEVSDLKIRDVDLRQNTITVVDGKGGKFRVVPLHAELKKVIKAWLQSRSCSGRVIDQSSEYLFTSERSGQMTTRAIAHMIDGYLERCGLLERSKEGAKLDGQHSSHSLRHTFCRRLVNVGTPLSDVARLAGHESIQTTTRYVVASYGDLKKAIDEIR